MNTDYETIFTTRLRRWGYTVYKEVVDAYEHGGRTKRKRAYIFATTFGSIPFAFPEKEVPADENSFWREEVEPYLAECRDVSNSKSIQDGAKCGRLRTVKVDSVAFPTLTKSQSRVAKDSLVLLTPDGRYLFPSESLERRIMGVPDDFNLQCVGKTIASEILGQAVEYISYSKLVSCIKSHVEKVKASFAPVSSRQLAFAF